MGTEDGTVYKTVRVVVTFNLVVVMVLGVMRALAMPVLMFIALVLLFVVAEDRSVGVAQLAHGVER